MYLSQALKRENNNLDMVRLGAACLVIYGHTNVFFEQNKGIKELIWPLIQFDYSGSLAVKIFFFFSGLVVANSLLEKKSLLQFSIARVFRIWPALIFLLLFTAYVIGPVVTNMPWLEYMKNPLVSDYVTESARMNIWFDLPGVFEGHKSQTVNGSLWSIPHEVRAYVLLAALFALGIHRIKWLAIVCCVWVCIDPFLPTRTLFTWIEPSKELDALLPCFAAGALLALFKAHIQVNLLPVIGFGVLYVMFKQAVFANYLFYGFFFFLLIYISTQKWFLSWRLPADISYGVYLWGWPVQQMLVWMWPDIGAKVHLMASLALAMLCGALSWYLLEKPGIRWGQRLYQKIEQKRRPPHALP